jgi:hypothetical protein
MTSYTINEATEWLKINTKGENSRIFEELYKYQEISEDESITEYLQYIYTNTLEWFKNSTPNLIQESSIKKIITAINHLITSNTTITELYGENECTELKKHIAEIFKNNKEEIIKFKSQETQSISSEDSISVDINNSDDWKSKYDRLNQLLIESQKTVSRLQKLNGIILKYLETIMDKNIWQMFKESWNI